MNFRATITLTLASSLSASAGVAAQLPAQPQPTNTAAIRGVVLSAADKKPISGVLISLNQSHRSTLPDDLGQFTFSGVPVGSEFVVAKKPGFLCSLLHSPQLTKCFENVDVEPGDNQVTLTMMPQAVVAGRVVDQAGAPIQGLPLSLMQREFVDGVFKWRRAGQTLTRTDAEGRFRIASLEPDSYLLQTSTTVDPRGARIRPDRGYAATYYSDVTQENAARVIVLQAGQDFAADLTVRNEQFQPVTLTLAWNRAWPSSSLSPMFSLFAEGQQEVPQPKCDMQSLTFNGFVPPGDYKFWVTFSPQRDRQTGVPLPWPDGSKQDLLARVEFTVKDKPVVIPAIPLVHPFTIPLHVQAEFTQQEKLKAASPPENPYRPPAVSFRLSDGDPQSEKSLLWSGDKNTLNLEFEDLRPGSYSVRGFADRGSYVAALSCGGINLLQKPLVVEPGLPPCSIEAVVRDDMASIAVGLTPNAKAQLTAAGITVTDVALIQVDNSLDTPYSSAVWLASEPEKKAIPPGKYLAFLFDGRVIAWRDPDERRRLKNLGTLVTLAPGESKTILLDWLPELNDSRIQPGSVGLGNLLLP